MSDPNHDNWLGYLLSAFINETITQSIECCAGCVAGKNSPLLHAHHQSGLLEKITFYFVIVRDLFLSKLQPLVEDYISKFPDPEVYDEAGIRVLKSFGRDFLNNCHPRSIYYSKHLTPTLDMLVIDTANLRIKPMNLKRIAKKLSKDRPVKRLKKNKNVV